MTYCIWFKDLSKDSVDVAGGKGANLGEMWGARFPIPGGFVVSAQTYGSFIDRTKIRDKILDILRPLNVDDTERLQAASAEIKKLIIAAPIPLDIRDAIVDAYGTLGIETKTEAQKIMQGKEEFVAVRSSATAEDLPSASFAGQQETFLNVRGREHVVDAVHKCWASLFTARAIYYRTKQNFPHEKVLIAVVVQKMVNSEKSGVMFTINPSTNNADEIVVEGAFGLGEAVVSGAVNPDLYIVEKNTVKIKKIELKEQKFKIVRDPITGDNIEKTLTPAEERLQVLTDKEIQELARIGKKLEEHYNHPQDVEWAVENGRIYVVQTRAVTTFKPKDERDIHVEGEENAKILLRGETACSGVATGPVRIIIEASELHKIQKGDIMVTTMTNPDMVPGMQKAAGIITDEGGMTSHAAIVSREMGTPCIVGTEKGTQLLKDGMIVTVHATRGIIYEGKVAAKEEKPQFVAVASSDPVTGTQVKVIMDFPDRAEQVARETNADGVGLLRLEFIIAAGGTHPAQYIRENRDEDYINLLVNEIAKVARAFKGKPVWARCSDLRSDEYRNLAGGDKEPHETDPMIGWHAIRRLLDEPRILKAEFTAIKRLHEQGLVNVGIMLPFVIRAQEVKRAKEYLYEVAGELAPKIKFGVMIETPAACWVIEDICKVGINFVSFGTNDLTQTTLGLDRNNQRIQKHFDEMHPAVLGEISMVIKACKKYGVDTSICGQAASRPEMAEFLVRLGIDSVSPNPDVAHEIRRVVAMTERKLLLEAERGKLERA